GREVCDGRMDADRCAPCMLENQGVPEFLADLLGRSQLKADALPDRWWSVKLAAQDLVRRHCQTSREFLDHASHIVACAEWSRQLLLLNGVSSEKISVHRQAMPGPSRRFQLRLPLDPRQTIRLGFFGRFVPDKGPDILLEALPYLRKKGL